MNKTQASALNDIYDYFINSQDFNGIPLRQIGEDLGISYEETIDIVIQLVSDDYCMIQSSTNPHIIRSNTYSISSQIKCLESAKEIKGEESLSEHINLITENTDFPICVYPSQTYLIHHREVSSMPFFTQKLSFVNGIEKCSKSGNETAAKIATTVQ